jgi:predicted HicB family RNase H-like nuclease
MTTGIVQRLLGRLAQTKWVERHYAAEEARHAQAAEEARLAAERIVSVTVSITQGEHQRMRAAADAAGRSLESWCREALRAAAARQGGRR